MSVEAVVSQQSNKLDDLVDVFVVVGFVRDEDPPCVQRRTVRGGSAAAPSAAAAAAETYSAPERAACCTQGVSLWPGRCGRCKETQRTSGPNFVIINTQWGWFKTRAGLSTLRRLNISSRRYCITQIGQMIWFGLKDSRKLLGLTQNDSGRWKVFPLQQRKLNISCVVAICLSSKFHMRELRHRTSSTWRRTFTD